MLSAMEPQAATPRSAPRPGAALVPERRDGADFASVFAADDEVPPDMPAAGERADATDVAVETGSESDAKADLPADRMKAAPNASPAPVDAGDEETGQSAITGPVAPSADSGSPVPVAAAGGRALGGGSPVDAPVSPTAPMVFARGLAVPGTGQVDADLPTGTVPTAGRVDGGAVPDPSRPLRVVAKAGALPAPEGAAPGRAAAVPLAGVQPFGPSPMPEGKRMTELGRLARDVAPGPSGAAAMQPQGPDAGAVTALRLAGARAAPVLDRAGPDGDRAGRLPESASHRTTPTAKPAAPSLAVALTVAGAAVVPGPSGGAGPPLLAEVLRRAGVMRIDLLPSPPSGPEGLPDMSGPGAAPLSGLPSGAASDPLLPAARQVAAALARAAESGQTAIELRLSPEELGTVRLRLDASGDGLSVSIQAERGETLDLMRRNIDLLSQHLRDIGYDSARFVFSQGGSASDNAYAPPPHPTSEPGTSAAPEVPTVPPPVLWLGDRLDIRL